MRAAIVGASVAGLVAARQLRLAGWNVAVYERSAGPNPSGYMMDFFGKTFRTGLTWSIATEICQHSTDPRPGSDIVDHSD